jgi:hypothetical protein
MRTWLPTVGALIFIASCTTTGKNVARLDPGMSKDSILKIMGPPADRSIRGTDEALQYQEIAGFGQCKYTTIWIADGKMIGVSTRRGGSVAGCGLGSRPVDWSEMPSPDAAPAK